ncbi:hypothetical protein [Thiomicrorhabdus xiamenensis]|uniref:Uncharacterized protein n=1 Tax=Thiomicrorhabdus xiamenensis TaxID=2739063 RepID=A0A7D4NY01_9GAMM|nr:hypothetical protein [Thiomicrorhabdus xiamenensis]QKI88898.1 hypothetical protein HQN79_04605 [Thiomicrorhabdus xiamenensis]
MLKNLLNFISQHVLKLAWFTMLFIPSIGGILTYFGYGTAFARSGAILVCFAIVIIFFNHGINRNIDYSKTVLGRLSKYSFNHKKIKEELDAEHQYRTPVLNDIQTKYNEQLAVFIQDLRSTHSKAVDRLDAKKARLVLVEFMSGLLGTLIWGFGDLLVSQPC